MATASPARARASDVVRPTPREAPVTSATVVSGTPGSPRPAGSSGSARTEGFGFGRRRGRPPKHVRPPGQAGPEGRRQDHVSRMKPAPPPGTVHGDGDGGGRRVAD